MCARLLRLAKSVGWWLLDALVTVLFSVGVWICSDMPNAWAAWKWRRMRKRVEAMNEHGTK